MPPPPTFEYDVFLSYSRADKEFSEKLSKRIRRYVPPKKTGLNKRKLRVFRDVDTLTDSPHLPDKLKEKLLTSERLALVCTPASAASTWVNDEVKIFAEHRGREFITFIRYKEELEKCLPPFLKDTKTNPLYIDFSERSRKKFRTESLRLIAAIYKVDFMYLLREDDARRRRMIVQWSISSFLFAFLLFSIYLISSVSSMYWRRIEQPIEYWPNRPAPIMPIHDIAINKQNPDEILYFGRNAEWPDDADAPLYSIRPDNVSKTFDSLAAVYLRNKAVVVPIATVHFVISSADDEFKGKGQLKLWGLLNEKGGTRYIRSISYEGLDSSNNSQKISFFPALVREIEHPFDIGRLVEKLVVAGMIDNTHNISASMTSFMDNEKKELSYSMDSDELLSDGYESREDYYGSQYFILSNSDSTPTALGVKLAEVKDDPSFWNEIEKSNDWLTYKGTMKSSRGTTVTSDERDEKELAHEVCLAIGDPANLGSLEKALVDLGVNWSEDIIHFTLKTLKTELGQVDMLVIEGERINRHDASTPIFIDWLVRLSPRGEWKHINMPSEYIQGIWPLDSMGESALLLSGDKGFFLTYNSGDSWKEANYNENGFASGKYVKTFVPAKNVVYALIDRGESVSDPENPLYRLQKRNWWERWRTGLLQLLQ